MRHKRPSGFTLIELMMVVAIIGLLASIALPKFSNLIRKSKEAAVYGSLGGLRSALTIYYSDNEGTMPSQTGIAMALTTGGKYIDSIPSIHIPGYQHTANNILSGIEPIIRVDNGCWYYRARSSIDGPPYWDADVYFQGIWISCTHADLKGQIWGAPEIAGTM